jgi:iron complex outermembrane receptor protein
MKVSPLPARSLRSALLLLTICFTAHQLPGQAASAPSPTATEKPAPTPVPVTRDKETKPADPKEVVVFAPFEVNADSDVGYLASNTLAGSRLNTALKDTAASISVMTPEFLSDIGALNLHEALAYASNTQQELSEEGPQGNRFSEFYATYRIRGVNASVARNFFVWKLPTDVYNVERIDQSRGPNSILFGVGSAGGIINTSTKQASTSRNFQSVGTVLGSDELYRGTIDVNRATENKKFGLRLNAVWEDAGSYKHYVYRETKAGHLAMRWTPTPTTTIRVEGELGIIDDNTARPWTLFNSVTTWEDSGSPILTTPVVDNARGLARYGANAARVTYIGNNGKLLDLRGAMLTSRPVPTPANDFIMADDSRVDKSIDVGGPGADRTTDFHTYTAAIEQRFGRATFVELAYNHQYTDFVSYDPGNPAHRYTADPNATMPTVGANPYAGQYFLDTNWTRRWRQEEADYFRITASTEFDLKKFGYYRIAGLAERQESVFRRDQKQEMFVGLPFGPIANTQNLVWRRNYVTPGDWSTYYVNGGKGQLLKSVLDPVSGQTLTSGWLQPNNSIDDDPSELSSLLGGIEARFFNNRLVAIGGIRQDRLNILNNGAIYDPSKSEFVVDYAAAVESEFEIQTRTMGLMWHAMPWLSLHYNKSTNNDLPKIAHRILPDDLNPTGAKGDGEDIGFTLNLFDSKAYFKAVYYTTNAVNDTDFRSFFTVSFQGRDMLDGLVNSGQITEAAAVARDRFATAGTYDRSADGYELEFVANPTKAWRISANYSRSNVIEDNVGDEAVAWVDDIVAYVRQFNTTVLTPSAITIDQQIAAQQATLLSMTATNGKGAIGNRRDKASLVTRYEVQEGALRNAYVGGTYRYQSGATAGRAASGELLFGNSLSMVDAFLGYRCKVFGGKAMLNLQLNIANLLDFEDPQITVVAPTGEVRRYQVLAPRSFRLSAKFDF